MQPVSLNDVADFLQTIFNSYDGYIYFAFVIMMTSSLAVLVRRLVVGYKQ